MVTRAYSRSDLRDCTADQLAADLDAALGRKGTKVDIAGKRVEVSHPDLTDGDDPRIVNVIEAYVLDPMWGRSPEVKQLTTAIPASPDDWTLETLKIVVEALLKLNGFTF